MVKSILFSLFAVALFAAGAVGSWYIMNLQKDADQNDPSMETALVSEVAPKQTAKKIEPGLSEFSTPVFSKALDGEDIFRFSAMNKKNMQVLKERHEALEKEEMRLKLVEQDLQVRKQEIEGILKQSERTVDEAESIINKLQVELQQLRAEKASNETSKPNGTPAADDDVQANIKVTAGWLQMMPPEAAAESVKKLANDGQKDFVLQLLSYIEDRNVAKILNALDDSSLAAEIMADFKMARVPKAKKR